MAAGFGLVNKYSLLILKSFINQSEAGRHITMIAADSSLVDLVCLKNPHSYCSVRDSFENDGANVKWPFKYDVIIFEGRGGLHNDDVHVKCP